MSAARTFAKIRRKADSMKTFIQLAVAIGSGYLLWKKFQTPDVAAPVAAPAKAGILSALTGPGVTILPSQQAPVVAYQAAVPDQVASNQMLATPAINPIDAKSAIEQAAALLVQKIG